MNKLICLFALLTDRYDLLQPPFLVQDHQGQIKVQERSCFLHAVSQDLEWAGRVLNLWDRHLVSTHPSYLFYVLRDRAKIAASCPRLQDLELFQAWGNPKPWHDWTRARLLALESELVLEPRTWVQADYEPWLVAYRYQLDCWNLLHIASDREWSVWSRRRWLGELFGKLGWEHYLRGEMPILPPWQTLPQEH